MGRPAVVDINLGELADLPHRASVALAWRCAERMSPFFRLPDDFDQRDRWRTMATDILRRVREYVEGADDVGGDLETAVKAAYEMAEATAGPTQFAGYVVAHSLQTLAHAIKARDEPSGIAAMQVVASTFGACRVLIQRSKPNGHELMVETLRIDMEKLRPVKGPVVLAELGDLWPAGTPMEFLG